MKRFPKFGFPSEVFNIFSLERLSVTFALSFVWFLHGWADAQFVVILVLILPPDTEISVKRCRFLHGLIEIKITTSAQPFTFLHHPIILHCNHVAVVAELRRKLLSENVLISFILHYLPNSHIMVTWIWIFTIHSAVNKLSCICVKRYLCLSLN